MSLLHLALPVVALLLAAGSGDQQIPRSTVPLSAADRAAIVEAGAEWARAMTGERPQDSVRLFSEAVRRDVGDDRLAGQATRIRETLGRLEFHHAELTELAQGDGWSRVLHVFVRSEGDKRWRDVQIALEGNRPFRFAQIAFIADVAEPVYLPAGDLPDPSARKWLDGYIDGLVRNDGLSGAVLVTRGKDAVVRRAFGYADAAGTTPITIDSRFSMASASKMFTAVLIARLVEQGTLAFGDPITRHLPADIVDPRWAQVTIDQLLSHRSGIGEYWTEEFSKAMVDVRTPRDFIPWIHKAAPTFAPGTDYRYSNSNFILLGLIVEHVTGRSYADELQRVILRPLGMTSTSLVTDRLPASRDAQPLSRDGEGWRHSGLPGHGSPAGGAWTTLADATTFLRALADGRLVSADTLKTLTTIRNGESDGLPYGYALEIRNDDGTVSWGHGGIARGVNAEVRYFPTLDTTLVMFSNQDNGAYDDLKKNTIRLITGAR